MFVNRSVHFLVATVLVVGAASTSELCDHSIPIAVLRDHNCTLDNSRILANARPLQEHYSASSRNELGALRMRLIGVYNQSLHVSRASWMPGPSLLDQNAAMWPTAVPRHIHLTCRNSSTLLNHDAKIVQAWKALNPGFAVTIHDNEVQRNFLAKVYPAEILEIYDKIPHWASTC